MKEVLLLVTKGIPFDVALSLTNNQRAAMIIAFGEMEGRKFDWLRGRWIETNK